MSVPSIYLQQKSRFFKIFIWDTDFDIGVVSYLFFWREQINKKLKTKDYPLQIAELSLLRLGHAPFAYGRPEAPVLPKVTQWKTQFLSG